MRDERKTVLKLAVIKQWFESTYVHENKSACRRWNKGDRSYIYRIPIAPNRLSKSFL